MVVVQDDTEDDIATNTLMIQIITISIAVVVLMVGSISSIVQPDNYSFLWTLGISSIVAGFGFIQSYYYKETVRLNTRGDLDFLLRLLKR